MITDCTRFHLLRADYMTGASVIDRLRALEEAAPTTVLIGWPNAQPYCFGWNGRDEFDYAPMDFQLDQLLRERSDLHFILAFGSLHGTPYYWSVDHFDQLAVYHANHPMQQPSLGSERWKTDSAEAARLYAAHFSGGAFCDRIVGFFPYSTGVDWMGIGECRANIPPHETPGGIEFPLEGDFSVPMQQAFRRFLQQKYGSDEALRDAWMSTGVTLADACVPSRIEVRSPLPQVRDYFECYNRLNADLCLTWCEALRLGAPDKSIWLTNGQSFGWPVENISPQGSGHNAPERLLASPDVYGFISAAVQSRDCRNPLPRHATASLKLHGKTVVHELSLPGLRETTVEDQCAEITLGIGCAAVHGCAVAIAEPRMGRGSMKDSREQFNPLPYDDETVRAHLRKLLDWHSGAVGEPVAEVAVFHSPAACYRRAMEKRFNEERIESFRNGVLARCGVPFDEYLLSDFAAVADRYKAWIFLDAADMAEADWKKVCGHPERALFACAAGAPPDTAALRAFAAANGVPVWCDTDDTVFANSTVCVFAAHSAGTKTITLPAGSWVDALTGEPVSGAFEAREKQVFLLERQ